jgi:hypothetical protein
MLFRHQCPTLNKVLVLNELGINWDNEPSPVLALLGILAKIVCGTYDGPSHRGFQMTSISTPWPVIPKDAVEYFRAAFAEANRAVTERIVNVPNIRETSLDDALIDALTPFSPPRRLKSGAIVEMAIHNIGGLRG